MQSKLTFVSLGMLATFVLGGCGDSPTIQCQTAMCSANTRSYQVCAHVDASITYDFAGASCSCESDDQQGCAQCSQEVAAYCGGGGTGGTGGNGAGGTGATGGVVICKATFSGGVTGTVTGCVATVTAAPGGGVTTLALTGDAIAGTSYTWSGFDLSVSGQPATGTFDQTAALGASTEITQGGAPNSPVWIAGHGNDQTFGSMSATLTSLGPATNAGGGQFFSQPHGTITATLVDQNAMTAQPSVMLTVTF